MAIPPKEGHYTVEDFQLKIDEAKAAVQWIESQLAAMKAHPEQAKRMFVEKAEDAEIAVPKGKDDAKLGDKDKPAYGMKK